MHDKSLSRRLLLASFPAAAMTGSAAAALGATSETSVADPVLAVSSSSATSRTRTWIALGWGGARRCCRAAGKDAMNAEEEALLVWLKTEPTTMVGPIVSLQHAAVAFPSR
jgi:hypothetical protein